MMDGTGNTALNIVDAATATSGETVFANPAPQCLSDG